MKSLTYYCCANEVVRRKSREVAKQKASTQEVYE